MDPQSSLWRGAAIVVVALAALVAVILLSFTPPDAGDDPEAMLSPAPECLVENLTEPRREGDNWYRFHLASQTRTAGLQEAAGGNGSNVSLEAVCEYDLDPDVDKPANVTLEVGERDTIWWILASKEDSPRHNVTLRVDIPSGLRVVGGWTEWRGALPPAGWVLTAEVEAVKKGDWRVYGHVLVNGHDGTRPAWGDNLRKYHIAAGGGK